MLLALSFLADFLMSVWIFASPALDPNYLALAARPIRASMSVLIQGFLATLATGSGTARASLATISCSGASVPAGESGSSVSSSC